MKGQLPHLRAAVYATPWAIDEDKLAAIAEVLERRALGTRLTDEELEPYRSTGRPDILTLHAESPEGFFAPVAAAGADRQGATGTAIAVIGIRGIIAQHASQVNDISGPGGTSIEGLQNAFRMALRDPQVSAIVFNVDSPGGAVSGVQMLADEIFKARGQKPMIAQVNSHMASAAYWIGSAADEIVMTPGATTGSIGVYGVHKDESVANEKAGVKYTMIKAGKFKGEGMPFEALGADAMSAMQDMVDSYYADFVAGVAKNRGVKAEDVRNGFGQGRSEKDKMAIKSGLADRIGTLDETLKRLSSKARTNAARATAAGTLPAMSAKVDQSLTVMRDDSGTYAESLPEKFSASMELVAETTDWTFKTKDGETASYEAIGYDRELDCVVMGKIKPVADAEDLEAQSPATDKPEMTAEDRDAFRRRRHAHRLRGGSI